VNVLLTGSHGLLGEALTRSLHGRGHTVQNLQRETIWASSQQQLGEALSGFSLLIHAAANTDVEECEKQPDACYRDNLLMTELLASAAGTQSLRMVFASSTGIYGTGKREPYCEFDSVHPTTHHHRSKYLAEREVLRHNPRNLIIRTGWLFGGRADNPKNFVARRIEELQRAARSGQPVVSNAEQFGSPSSCDDVAMRLLELAEQGRTGVYNCVNTGQASRHAYVQEIGRLANLDVAVTPGSASGFHRVAQVSFNEAAHNWKMNALGLTPMPDWQEALAKTVRRLLPEQVI
jgi:dTDP-4-dehydrorhamnose reductase